MNRLQEIYNRVIKHPIRSAATVLVLVTIIVVGLSLPFYLNQFDEMYLNVLAEAHGMIFDILVIGILLFWLREQGEIKQRISQYRDEIDDFRMWESEEAAFRNAGNIKRLNRHGITKIDLVGAYLTKTNLSNVRLMEANMNTANISNTILLEANLEAARLNQTNFENANINQANLSKTYASGANFKDAFLIKANFEGAFLIKTNFHNAYLMEANLKNCSLTEADFEDANLYKADLRGADGLSLEQLAKAKSLYLAKFDPDLYAILEKEVPDLIG
jgi:BTB/POZ domain-containing protein KCTD9